MYFNVASTSGAMILNNSGQLLVNPLGVSSPSFGFTNDTNTGMTRPTGDTLQFVDSSERMRMTSTGAIGMGTTPPSDTHTGWTQVFRLVKKVQ